MRRTSTIKTLWRTLLLALIMAVVTTTALVAMAQPESASEQIGRASCRERV